MRRVQELSVGFGQADLNAPLGGSMPGYFTDRKATSVHDPLLARAIHLRRGDTRGLLVSLDLIGLPETEVHACRHAVETATGIPSSHVWIHATHTHTGAMVPRRFTSDAAELVPDSYPGVVDEAWVSSLPGRVVQAAESAVSSSRPTAAEYGETEVRSVAFYRRFRMKDGTIRTNPGRSNPDIVAPAGEIDPRLTVLRFPGSHAVVAIYGVHPDVISGTAYSADYPYFMARRVEETLGEGWNLLFLNAACGNINHVDVHDADQKGGFPESERIGRALGDGVSRALRSPRPLPVDRLAFASSVVPSRLRHIPEQELADAERLLREEPEKAKSFNGLFAPAAVVLGRTRDTEQSAEVSALRLGPFGMVGLPGEIFVELARRVMHDSPLDITRVIGLTNGSLGYIPHAPAYEQGGYESGYRSARFEPGTGEAWADAAVELLRSLASR